MGKLLKATTKKTKTVHRTNNFERLETLEQRLEEKLQRNWQDNENRA